MASVLQPLQQQQYHHHRRTSVLATGRPSSAYSRYAAMEAAGSPNMTPVATIAYRPDHHHRLTHSISLSCNWISHE
jgi:hypothetical protein